MRTPTGAGTRSCVYFGRSAGRGGRIDVPNRVGAAQPAGPDHWRRPRGPPAPRRGWPPAPKRRPSRRGPPPSGPGYRPPPPTRRPSPRSARLGARAVDGRQLSGGPVRAKAARLHGGGEAPVHGPWGRSREPRPAPRDLSRPSGGGTDGLRSQAGLPACGARRPHAPGRARPGGRRGAGGRFRRGRDAARKRLPERVERLPDSAAFGLGAARTGKGRERVDGIGRNRAGLRARGGPRLPHRAGLRFRRPGGRSGTPLPRRRRGERAPGGPPDRGCRVLLRTRLPAREGADALQRLPGARRRRTGDRARAVPSRGGQPGAAHGRRRPTGHGRSLLQPVRGAVPGQHSRSRVDLRAARSGSAAAFPACAAAGRPDARIRRPLRGRDRGLWRGRRILAAEMVGAAPARRGAGRAGPHRGGGRGAAPHGL